MNVIVKLESCGFCGRSGSDSCTEFGIKVSDHSERSMTLPELFIAELDGITAQDAAQAAEWEWQEIQSREEIYAESGWLRAAENNYFSAEEGGY